MLQSIVPLSDSQLRWQPPNGANSVAWILWHIPEVEDNWVRDKLLDLPRRYPFGESVKAFNGSDWPSKSALLAYFHEVRALTRQRLEDATEEEFNRVIRDEHFGSIAVRQLWAGVAMSCQLANSLVKARAMTVVS